MRRKITIFTIILQLRVPCVCALCVCVCECVTIWIIKCTFYALFFCTALSTNFLYFVALQTDTLDGGAGEWGGAMAFGRETRA